MITIEQNLDGTYTLTADGSSMRFATYDLAKQFMLDYADGEITESLEIC